MIGMMADFPVREMPLITLSVPSSNGTTRGANPGRRDQSTSCWIWKRILERDLERESYFVWREFGAPRAEFLRARQQGPDGVGDAGCGRDGGERKDAPDGGVHADQVTVERESEGVEGEWAHLRGARAQRQQEVGFGF